MGNHVIAPAAPEADLSGGPTSCPACGHAREGNPVPPAMNRRLERKGKTLLKPRCNSGFDMGFGDVDHCECSDASHSEMLSDKTRYL